MKERCAKQVFEPGGTFRGHPCMTKGTITEEGQLWCWRHAPSAEVARRKKRQADFDAKWNAERAANKKAEAIEEAATDLVLAVKEARHMTPLPEGIAFALRKLEEAEAK